MVPTGPLPDGPRATEPSPRLAPGQLWVAMGVVTTLFVAVCGVALFVKVPYYALTPGSARDVPPLVSFTNVETQEAGEIVYLTINLEEASIFTALRGWVDGDIQVVSAEAILGDGSKEENQQANEQLMADSKDYAQMVALTRLGIEVSTSATGARVIEVTEGTPAAGAIDVGDTIVAVDGAPVSFPEDLGRLLGEHAPGEEVTLTIDGAPAADGAVASRTTDVTLARCGEVPRCLESRPDEPDSAFFGVASEPRDFRADLPLDVVIDTEGVGGPSAGLAFTLTLLDLLTEGDLTGGRRIAVTGTIEPDGTVGDVGGVVQKAAAAAAAGAEVMFVPVGEYEEVGEGRHGLDIIAVATLDDALVALEELGGDPLPEPGTVDLPLR